jgi:cystathionine gamma-synthase/methionine-gamma-lyase
VRRVYYPGLPDHPQHAVASSQFGDLYGGMVAFDLEADREVTLQFIDALSVIAPGTSLGDVESLVLYPPLSSHRMLTPEELETFGIGQSLVRLSVGIESPRDLIGDLDGAAEAAGLTVVARAGA